VHVVLGVGKRAGDIRRPVLPWSWSDRWRRRTPWRRTRQRHQRRVPRCRYATCSPEKPRTRWTTMPELTGGCSVSGARYPRNQLRLYVERRPLAVAPLRRRSPFARRQGVACSALHVVPANGERDADVPLTRSPPSVRRRHRSDHDPRQNGPANIAGPLADQAQHALHCSEDDQSVKFDVCLVRRFSSRSFFPSPLCRSASRSGIRADPAPSSTAAAAAAVTSASRTPVSPYSKVNANVYSSGCPRDSTRMPLHVQPKDPPVPSEMSTGVKLSLANRLLSECDALVAASFLAGLS